MKKHYLIIILTAIFLLQVAYAQPITIISIGDDITIPYETIDNSPEVIISTIESSLCKYSDINKTFLEMENTFTQDEENVTHNHIISQKAIGEYEIYIKCQNNDYINSSLNSSFTINEIPDITPPVITISNINSDSEDPYQVNIENVTIIILTDENSICKYDDTNSDYDLMSLNFVGENLEHTLLLENLPSGNYSSYIGCSDIDDNSDSQNIEFEVIINEPEEEDITAPIITISSINLDSEDPYQVNIENVTIIIETDENSICKYDDTNSDYDSMSLSFTGETLQHVLSLENISSGNYSSYIGCSDIDDNSDSQIIEFEVIINEPEEEDTTAPIITVSSINSDSEEPYQVNIENITITIETDENSICKYDDTNSDYNLMSLNFVGENLEHTLLLENLPSGNYSSYIGCSDIDDNPDSKIIEFEVIINEDEIIPPTEEDTVPPTITINNPKNGEIFTNGFNFIINVTINETANSCIYTINNSNSVSFDETNSIDFITTETKLFNGEYDLKIACSDLFNNTGESQITFSINDNIDPSITIQSIGSDSNSPYETTDTTPLIVIETNEPSFCKFSYVNLNYTNMTTMSSTLPYNTSHSITSQAQSIGSKTNYVTCLDSNNNIKNISFSYNIIAKPPKEDNDDDDDDSSSSNRNSGSSQGVSIPSKLLSNEYSTLWLDLEQGEHSMIIAKESFPVTEIIFDVKNNIKNTVKITITKLDKPNMFLNNETYNYFKITKEGILDDNIENINIIFKVDKSWIKNNEIENILLHKYKGKWKELITIFLKKDNNYEYFKTTLSEFGEFAISGEKIEPIIILTEESIEEPQFTGNLNFENSLSRNTEETMPLDLAPDTNKTQALNLVFPLMGLISFSFLSLYFVFHFKYPVANELQIAQIKSYIDQSFDNGTHQETIKKRLVNVGWNPHLIDMMILNVHTPSGNKKNLERYIRSSKKNGLSSIIVKENLLKRGWSKNILQKFLIEHYVEDY